MEKATKQSITMEEYNKAREKAYEDYKRIGKIFCPYLESNVYFNSDGFRHIIYKSRGNYRHINTQILRFNLLKKAVKLLSKSHVLQEYDSLKRKVIIDDHKNKIQRTVETKYYGFIGIIDGWKIKVIIKKTGNGNPVFWSVIPNWVTNRKRDMKKNYLTHSGNLEKD